MMAAMLLECRNPLGPHPKYLSPSLTEIGLGPLVILIQKTYRQYYLEHTSLKVRAVLVILQNNLIPHHQYGRRPHPHSRDRPSRHHQPFPLSATTIQDVSKVGKV